jgi:hypothetical protein
VGAAGGRGGDGAGRPCLVSNWTKAPAGGRAPAVIVTAFRNRTWVEWAVYATCQLRRLGVATTLVYSSSEVRRLYPLAWLPGLEQLGFWAGVEAIPDLRLVDLDDWYPAAEQAASWRDFAREFAPAVAAYDLHAEENEEGPLAPAYRRASPGGDDAGGDGGRGADLMSASVAPRVHQRLIAGPAICEAARGPAWRCSPSRLGLAGP